MYKLDLHMFDGGAAAAGGAPAAGSAAQAGGTAVQAEGAQSEGQEGEQTAQLTVQGSVWRGCQKAGRQKIRADEPYAAAA